MNRKYLNKPDFIAVKFYQLTTILMEMEKELNYKDALKNLGFSPWTDSTSTSAASYLMEEYKRNDQALFILKDKDLIKKVGLCRLDEDGLYIKEDFISFTYPN